MKKACYLFVLMFSFLFSLGLFGQEKIAGQEDSVPTLEQNFTGYSYSARKLIIPSALLLYGATGLFSNSWTKPNIELQHKVVNKWNTPFKVTHYDDYMLVLPAMSVYGLNLVGVRGQHEFWDRSVILGTSAVITGVVVEGLKKATRNLRPDGTTYDSWPSGHTAVAFACAEFLYQEYKEESVWYGVAGYTLATAVGGMRIYNNRHWLTDVSAGAGFGILSTKTAYWLFPYLKEEFFTCHRSTKRTSSNLFLTPTVASNRIGFQFVAAF